MNHRLLTCFIFSAMAAALFVSCKEEQMPKQQPDNEADVFVLNVSVPDVQAKSSITKDGDVYKTLWSNGDVISVNGNLSNPLASGGDKSASFTFSANPSAPYKVLYPGTSSQNVISLPATQNYVAGSVEASSNPSWGNATNSGSGYSASLNPFCGIIRFALKGSATLSKIELNSLGSEKLYGNFTLATDANGFTGAFSGGTAGTLTYSFGSGLTLSGSDTYIYIAIPGQNYASGIEALVYQSDGAFMRLKFWGSGHNFPGTQVAEFESKTFAAGRTENLLGINSLTAEAGGEPTAEAPGITVGVYNIKMDENRVGANNTYIDMDRADVQAALGASIVGMAADIFGINEIGEDNLVGEEHDIKAMAVDAGLSSSNYTWKMNYPNKVDRDGTWLTGYSYSAIMYYANVFVYNNTTIAIESDGYVWLCNDDDDYWSSMENAYEHSTGRHTAVYAKCRHKVSGKRFWFIVTHFDTYYDNASSHTLNNLESLEVFAEHLKNDVEDLPIIAVGDLNFGPKEKDKTTDVACYGTLTSYWTDAYDKVKADGNMSSYYQTYDGTQSGSQHNYYYPFITFTKNHPDRRLDHIITKNGASQNVTPISYKTIRRTYEAPNPDNTEENTTWCPSDHLPVVAYITFD